MYTGLKLNEERKYLDWRGKRIDGNGSALSRYDVMAMFLGSKLHLPYYRYDDTDRARRLIWRATDK